MEIVRDRLLKFCADMGIPQAKLCEQMCAHRSYLHNVVHIPADKLEMVLNHNPHLSRQWLLYGIGEMLVKDLSESKTDLVKRLSEKDKEIEELKAALVQSQKVCAYLTEQLSKNSAQ